MFNYILGKITDRFDGGIVLENNGIGYEIFVSSFCFESLRGVEEEIKLFTYFQVKEDGVCLFGFLNKEERNLFLKLITVSGVGPKGAMAILSGVSAQELVKIIAMQDSNALSKIKGVGKKTAERILVELKDKIDVLPMDMLGEKFVPTTSAEIDDACEVLISLGISKQEAYRLAQSVFEEGLTAEDIIAKALQNHNGR